MNKIFIFVLVAILLAGIGFYFFNQSIPNSAVPLEQRVYLAPSTFVQLPSITGDIFVRFGQDRLTLDGEQLKFLKAPEWTLFEAKDRYTNFVIGKITVVPADEKIKHLEQNALGESGGYSIYTQKTVINENVLTQEIVAEKVLEGRSDLMLKIETPYKDEPNQKFRNETEARAFLEEILAGINYNDTFFATSADKFEELESNIFSLFGGFDPDDVDEIKNWPEELMTTILLSELQQVPLDIAAQRTFKEEGAVSDFCNKLYEGANSASEIIPDTLSCVSSDKDILLLITLDSDVQYCTDSRGFRGLVKNGSVSASATMCQ